MGRACLPSVGLSTKSCVLTAMSWQTRSAPSLQPPGNTTLIVPQVCKATSAIRVEDVSHSAKCIRHLSALSMDKAFTMKKPRSQENKTKCQVQVFCLLCLFIKSE